MQTQAQFETVWQAAIRYLAVKSYSVGEISQKLRDKRLPQPLIMQVIRKLEELDFVNDRRYAQIYVENLKRQGRTTFEQLARSLTSKGFRAACIRQAIKRADSFE